MNTFVSAIGKPESGKTTTTNGAITRKSSMNHLVDFFYSMGASRNKTPLERFQAFLPAYQSESNLTLRTLLYLRDVRGGMGERNYFRELLIELTRLNQEDALKLIPLIKEVGRADDLFSFVGTPLEPEALTEFVTQLKAGNKLFFKWAPRENSSKRQIASKLRRQLSMTTKQYRKFLVENTTVVETPMCARKWSDIVYSHVPSQAARIYSKAFLNRDTERYQSYLKDVTSGKSTINASAIYPYEVIKGANTANTTEQTRIIAQWNALPNYLPEINVLPMIDTSGSMDCPAGKTSVTCREVAVSLGLYVASKSKGAFKDVYMEFSGESTLHKVEGDIITKIKSLKNIIANTNLIAAIENILSFGIKHKVPNEEMPQVLLIFSDMQFDANSFEYTTNKEIKLLYKNAGYSIPSIVYWNLNDRSNVPVKQDKKGVALVSGFSPALMKTVLESIDDLTPETTVLKAIMNPRYQV